MKQGRKILHLLVFFRFAKKAKRSQIAPTQVHNKTKEF
jgi:hypothetical protein